MDEYLFIALAKLKADRLKLERHRQGADADSGQLPLGLAEPVEAPRARGRNSLFARWFSQQPSWREQS